MKIVRVVRWFMRVHPTGPSRHSYLLTDEIAKRGHKNVVYTFQYSSQESSLEEHKNVTIKRYKPLVTIGPYAIAPRMLADLVREDMDILHVHGYRNFESDVAAIAAKTRNTPLVLTPHGSIAGFLAYPGFSTLGRMSNYIYDAMTFRRVIRLSSKIVVTSNCEMQDALNFGVPPEKLTLIPHGIPLQISVSCVSQGAKKSLLCVGRLSPIRNLEFLIRAFSLVVKDRPDARLYIVGGERSGRYVGSKPKYKLKLDFLCKRLGVSEKVTFVGWLAGKELHEMYASCHIFVFSSLYENFGHTFLEAASHGKPIVSTPVGVAPDLIGDDEGGFVVAHNDVEGFSKSVLTLLSDDEFYENASKKIAERVQRYSLESMVNQYEALYKELLEETCKKKKKRA